MSNLFRQIQTIAVAGGGGDVSAAAPRAANRKTRAEESEHRIKNHLQLIGSSLAIQARGAVHAEARELLIQAYGRISAIARLHARWRRSAAISYRAASIGCSGSITSKTLSTRCRSMSTTSKRY